MQMGTTAQPEPLFALVMLGGAIAYQRGRYEVAASLLGAAAVLRYEAWASVAAIGALALFDFVGPARGARRTVKQWIVVAVPVVLVVAWAALRVPVDGRWFGFLRETRQFASGATHQKSALDGGVARLVHDALYYPLFVPLRVMGPALPLVPFGVVRTVRDQGARFVIVLAACLAFVSLTWVARSSLGLDRHFVVVVPLYATFAAQGVAVVADAGARFAARWTPRLKPALVGQRLAAVLSLASLGALAVTLAIWMGFWKDSIARGWPRREEFGGYLRTLPAAATIFCDEATVEILSRLDRKRFDRHWTDDPHTWNLVADAARAQGVVYVATWNDKLAGHEHAGDVVFRLRDRESDASSELAVMRVTPDASHAAR
jgi:hypothetical protein